MFPKMHDQQIRGGLTAEKRFGNDFKKGTFDSWISEAFPGAMMFLRTNPPAITKLGYNEYVAVAFCTDPDNYREVVTKLMDKLVMHHPKFCNRYQPY